MMPPIERQAGSRCRPFFGENGTMTLSLRGMSVRMQAELRVMESSGYDLAWACIGRGHATKLSELSFAWSTAPISSLRAAGKKMSNLANDAHHWLDLAVGQ
jgi:hypothetical protein